MRILVNDVLQSSDAPACLLSPALSDYCTTNPATITLDAHEMVTHIGIGSTDASAVSLAITHIVGGFPQVDTFAIAVPAVDPVGLYEISETPLEVVSMVVSHDGLFIGRLAAGIGRHIGTSKAKEPGYQSTNESRVTLSGQIIPGAGGHFYRSIGLDSRYKIDADFLADIKKAYPTQIGRGFPFFFSFEDEAARIPFARMYASDKNQRAWVFDGSINKMRYSFKFNLTERF